MRKILPQFIQQISSPAFDFTRPLFSITRLQQKRKAVKLCKKLWGYRSSDSISDDILRSYMALNEALKHQDLPMILRHMSVPLFEKYEQGLFKPSLTPEVSDIVIRDGQIVKGYGESAEWLHLHVIIKHHTFACSYGVERRIETTQHESPRKWVFNRLPDPSQK